MTVTQEHGGRGKTKRFSSTRRRLLLSAPLSLRCRRSDWPSGVQSKLANRSRADALKGLSAARAQFDAQVLVARAATGAIQRTHPMLRRPDLSESRLTGALAHRLALSHFQSELRRLDREEVPSRSSDDWRPYVSDVEMELATLSDPDNPNTCRWTEAAEIGLLSEHQLIAEPSSEESRLLRAYLRRALFQIAQLKYARLQGDYQHRVTDGMFDECAIPSAATTSKANTAEGNENLHSPRTMLDTTIVDLWAAERKPNPRGIDDHRSAALWFYERVGRKAVSELVKGDVRAFKAQLVKEGKSPANIKQKLSRLRTLLQWAEDNDLIQSNPAR